MTRERLIFARRCEELAALFLAARGYRIAARNWRTRRGEIDIVARRGKELVFVEVKGKRGEGWGRPEEMVDRRKMGRVVTAALEYLALEGESPGRCRFDVIAVSVGADGRWSVEHHPAAFSLDGP